jgi:stearoyl-CoA desaturase (Delta-9 desaturase)
MKIFGYTLTFYLYIAIYVVAIVAVFLVPFSWNKVAAFGLCYFFGMFFITAGYHRYFSHRSFKLDRIPQFILAWLCMATAQKGILWWAANHRDHHVYSDTEKDLHSPVVRGFWYSHIGWIFDEHTQGYNPRKVADFTKYPELVFVDKYYWLPTFSYAAVVMLIGGFPLLVWAYALPILCMYQASYCVNSLAHVFGSKRFDTGDESRNNWFLAIITLGEGWHNNHHYYKASCRQGYKWWEIDMTFYMLTILSWVGIVKEIRPFRIDNKQVHVKAEETVA